MESVWDYPRPPLLEPCNRVVEVVFAGQTIASTEHSYRVLETSHPPVYYIPPEDVRWEFVQKVDGKQSVCEWKGAATYWDVHVGERVAKAAGWSYDKPTHKFSPMAGFIAFYASRMDECRVNGERVQAQPGDFYGGWITSDIRGPFKGVPGSWGW